jgi:hypothetical protein
MPDQVQRQCFPGWTGQEYECGGLESDRPDNARDICGVQSAAPHQVIDTEPQTPSPSGAAMAPLRSRAKPASLM